MEFQLFSPSYQNIIWLKIGRMLVAVKEAVKHGACKPVNKADVTFDVRGAANV